jgi:hypothetical protein
MARRIWVSQTQEETVETQEHAEPVDRGDRETEEREAGGDEQES